MSAETPSSSSSDSTGAPSKRRQVLGSVAAAVLLAGGAYAAWWFVFARATESTDNAYVQANVVQVTAQVGGTVVAIEADDTDYVRTGQLLVKLDPSDARIALTQAEAQLAQTVREVRQLYAGNATLQSQVAARDADLARARSELARAGDDASRRGALVGSGAVGKEEFNHATSQVTAARSAVAAAESALQAARDQLIASRNLTEGSTIAAHPQIERAAARVRETWLALRRAELVAPVDGHVARRSVQVGQRVQAGAPLMALVSLRDAWVDANFKEGQLQNLRLGQPAKLWADVYGKQVEYHGVVVGLGAGTGAAFALLPAQNATGNWIKVVQRVPVRIKLDAKELALHPLRVGLSMQATVDVSRQDGKILADAPHQGAVAETQVFDLLMKEADAQVQRIISANLGRASSREVKLVPPKGPALTGTPDDASALAVTDPVAVAAVSPR
jgi:membrane fusion protein (multidrug efflux system)